MLFNFVDGFVKRRNNSPFVAGKICNLVLNSNISSLLSSIKVDLVRICIVDNEETCILVQSYMFHGVLPSNNFEFSIKLPDLLLESQSVYAGPFKFVLKTRSLEKIYGILGHLVLHFS